MPERAAKIAFAPYNWDLFNKYYENDEEFEEHESSNDIFYRDDFESNSTTEEEEQQQKRNVLPSRPEVELLNCDELTDGDD